MKWYPSFVIGTLSIGQNVFVLKDRENTPHRNAVASKGLVLQVFEQRFKIVEESPFPRPSPLVNRPLDNNWSDILKCLPNGCQHFRSRDVGAIC